MFGKAEFFALAPSIIGDTINPPSNSTFVKAMYQVLLNRAPTAAELTTTLGRIAVRGRAGVALDLMRGNEYRLKVVKDAYLQFLGRTIIDTDPEAVAGLTLLRANRWEVLYSNLLVSRDFYEVNN